MPEVAENTHIIGGLFTVFAFEQITVSTVVKSLTTATLTDSDGNRAMQAIITIEGAQFRYRTDGANPSSSVGHLVNPFDTIVVLGPTNIRAFRAIKAGTTDAKISISYAK